MRTLIFVVNGQETRVTLRYSAFIETALARALVKTKNAVRPFSDWEIRYQNGVRIPPRTKVAILEEGSTVYASLQLGAGGCS